MISLAATISFLTTGAFSFGVLHLVLGIATDAAIAAAWVSGHLAQITTQIETTR